MNVFETMAKQLYPNEKRTNEEILRAKIILLVKQLDTTLLSSYLTIYQTLLDTDYGKQVCKERFTNEELTSLTESYKYLQSQEPKVKKQHAFLIFGDAVDKVNQIFPDLPTDESIKFRIIIDKIINGNWKITHYPSSCLAYGSYLSTALILANAQPTWSGSSILLITKLEYCVNDFFLHTGANIGGNMDSLLHAFFDIEYIKNWEKRWKKQMEKEEKRHLIFVDRLETIICQGAFPQKNITVGEFADIIEMNFQKLNDNNSKNHIEPIDTRSILPKLLKYFGLKNPKNKKIPELTKHTIIANPQKLVRLKNKPILSTLWLRNWYCK